MYCQKKRLTACNCPLAVNLLVRAHWLWLSQSIGFNFCLSRSIGSEFVRPCLLALNLLVTVHWAGSSWWRSIGLEFARHGLFGLEFGFLRFIDLEFVLCEMGDLLQEYYENIAVIKYGALVYVITCRNCWNVFFS